MFVRILPILAMATGVLSTSLTVADDFISASAYIKNLPKDQPSTASVEDQLAIYANFKLATVGKAQGGAPLMPLPRMMFNAWVELGDKDQTQAMIDYVELADRAAPEWRVLDSDFRKAAAYIKNLPKDQESTASAEDRLAMYANYKIATAGKATGDAPLMPIPRMMFNAWVDLGDKNRAQAKIDYIALADKVAPAWRN